MGKAGAKVVVVHYYIRGFDHGWPNTREQDDDGQRYGPVGWTGTGDIVGGFFWRERGWAINMSVG